MNARGNAKKWFRRMIAASAAVAASVVLATSTAHAYIPPSPVYVGTPGIFEVSMYCGGGRINISPLAAVQSGFTYGQYASYRYALYSGGRLITSTGFSTPTHLAYAVTSWGATTNYGRSLVGSSAVPVTPGYVWEVAVQVAWLTPSGWTYSQWQTPDGFRSGYVGPALPYKGVRECRS